MTRRLSSSRSPPPKSDDDFQGIVPRSSGFDLPHSRSAAEFRKTMRDAESQATNPSAASSRTPSAAAKLSSWRPVGRFAISMEPVLIKPPIQLQIKLILKLSLIHISEPTR